MNGQLESRASRDATGACARCGARVCVRCGRGDRSLILNGTVAGWACHPECPPRSSVAGAPEEATALTHSRSCGYHDSETGCTCCLDERIAADNWREQYAAWFKRANEAETEVATLRARVSQLESTIAEAHKRANRLAGLLMQDAESGDFGHGLDDRAALAVDLAADLATPERPERASSLTVPGSSQDVAVQALTPPPSGSVAP